jgi:sugar lactone lactonase YvrE
VTTTGNGNVTGTVGAAACSGNCAGTYTSGTVLTLTAQAGGNAVFTGWGGACSGTGTCDVTMTADRAVTANFLSFTVTTPDDLSMIAGESRTIAVTTMLTGGSGVPVSLSLSTLPDGATSGFSPASITPTSSSTLTITTDASTPVAETVMTVTAAFGAFTKTAQFVLRVRSALHLDAPQAVAVESGGATALVAEVDRVVRINIASRMTTKTITTGLGTVRDLALESGGASVLAVAAPNSLWRVTLATGVAMRLSMALIEPRGIAIESSGTSAIVTDEGGTSASGRVVRVDLASGTVTPITSAGAGLNAPRGVAIEASGSSALVAEFGGRRLLRVNLSSGGITPLATNLVNAAGPRGVAIEPGGASALVTGSGQIVRIVLATGTLTEMYAYPTPNLAGIALESGGGFALIADTNLGRIVRVAVTSNIQTLAPSRQSLASFIDPWGVAIEAGGATALVADCSPAATAAPCNDGRVVRADLATGVLTSVTAVNQFSLLRGIEIESGGTTALVTELGSPGRILRIALSNGAVSPITTGLSLPYAVVTESGGATALFTDNNQLKRVTLSNGMTSPIATVSSTITGLAIEPGGATAVGVDATRVFRATLSSGAVSSVYEGLTAGLQSSPGIALESGGTTALVTEPLASGRLLRVDLGSGAATVLAAALGNPVSVAPETGGTSALVMVAFVDGNLDHQFKLVRVQTAGTGRPVMLNHGLNYPTSLALEDSGTTALMLDWGSPNPNETTGRVVRVDLETGAQTLFGGGLFNPHALAIEESGDALVLDIANATGQGRLVRVSTAGQVSLVASGLGQPEDFTIEAGGSTVLMTERVAGNVLRVDLGDGSFSILASGITNPRQIRLEPEAETALVSHDGGISRVDLLTGSVTLVVPWNVQRFAVELGGTTALVIGNPPAAGNGRTFADALARVDLATGAVTVLTPRLFDSVHTLVLESPASLLVTEHRSTSGALLRMTVP